MIRSILRQSRVNQRLGRKGAVSGQFQLEGFRAQEPSSYHIDGISHDRSGYKFARSYSSKQSPDENSSSKELSSRESPNEKEPITLFFEKRIAALEKQKERNQQRFESKKTNNRRPNNRNQNSRNNQHFHQNRQQDQQHQRKRFDRQRNKRYGRNEGFNDRKDDYSNGERKNEGLSDVLEKMSRNRNRQQNLSQRSQNNRDHGRENNTSMFDQNRNDRAGRYSNRNNKQEGTLRLAEMMRKLRKDAPTNAHQGRSEDSFADRSTRHDDRNSRDSWRHKRFASPEHGARQVRPGQRNSGRGSKSVQGKEFLHGRISRTDDNEFNESNGDKPERSLSDRVVTLPVHNSLTPTEASALLRVKVDDIRKALKNMDLVGQDSLDIDTLELLAMDFGIETTRSTNDPVILDSQELLMQQRRSDVDEDATSNDAAIDSYPPRPPIVTIMGHVDHGKTTLMDALRRRSLEQQTKGQKSKKSKKKKSKNSKGTISKDVAGTEAGGITQIISAFQVAMEGQDEKVTFLDTPGHAAFRAMRQSGSHAADVIVLVVAADDGISEQTVEIIDFYKSIVKGSSDSGISMVVAVNKIDKPGIDPKEAQMRIENQLLEHGIVSEGMSSDGSEYGQPVQVIPTSGLTGEGLDDLMEGLLLQSEVMDLRADDTAFAEGIIMDARQEKGLGVVADCIVRRGKIEKGNVIMSGDQVSQVRMLKDVNNKMLSKGLPSQPVRIVGFKSLPKAGDPIMVVESEEVAEEMVEQRQALEATTSDRPDASRSDVELHITGMRRGDTWRVKKFTDRAAINECDGTIRIPIIVKADADGSLAAVRESLMRIGDDSKHTVVIDPIMEGIGEVTHSDIQMAKESEATIFSFGSIRVDQSTTNLAASEGVSICSNNIIYSLLDEAKDVLGSYLPLIPEEHSHGRASVKATFTVDTEDGKEKIAGLNVLSGNIFKSKAQVKSDDNSNTIELDSRFRVYRDGELISPEDTVISASSLRRFKEVVESVKRGDECGLGLSGFTDFQEGDEIECYSIEMRKAKL